MKVLVIGANGRLGKACVTALHEKGAVVIAFVRTKTTFPATLQQKCEAVIEGDARDQAQLEAALRDHACDSLIQAAGYTPFFPGVATDMPLIFERALDAASKVARERSGGGGVDPDKRLRAWMMNDVANLDSPYEGDGNTLFRQYLPPMFTVHRTTYALLMKRPTDEVAWSLMCPGQLQPGTHKVAAKKVVFVGPKHLYWDEALLWVPLLGRYLNALYVGLFYIETTFDNVAQFMVDDLGLGLKTQLIGRKVGPMQTPDGR